MIPAAVLAAIVLATGWLGGSDGSSDSGGEVHGAVQPVPGLGWELRPLGWGQGPSVALRSGARLDSTPYPQLRIPFLTADGIATSDAVVSAPATGVTPIVQATATSLPQPNPLSIPEKICAYGWPCGEALAVAECESTFNPNAYNQSGASGVFQLMMPLHAWRLEGESPFNADANIKAAYGLYIEQGWWPWKQCWP